MDEAPQTMAIAAMVAALVETLDETHVGFTRAFLRHLDEKRVRLGDGGSDDRQVLEPLLRTRALLMEDLDRAEPASVVYAKERPLEDQLPSSDKIQLPTLDAALQFWSRLPNFDREHATIETASGHRLDFAAISGLVKRQRERINP